MSESGYKRVDSESDGGSRTTSLDLKRNEGRSEGSDIGNEDEDFFAWRKAYLTVRRLRGKDDNAMALTSSY